MKDGKNPTGILASAGDALGSATGLVRIQTRMAARFAKLDELYVKIQIVSGYTVEQLIDLFASGCIISRPAVKPGVPMKVLHVKGYTPEELVHLIRSACCSIFADDDEIKVFGELEVYASEEGPYPKELKL